MSREACRTFLRSKSKQGIQWDQFFIASFQNAMNEIVAKNDDLKAQLTNRNLTASEVIAFLNSTYHSGSKD